MVWHRKPADITDNSLSLVPK